MQIKKRRPSFVDDRIHQNMEESNMNKSHPLGATSSYQPRLNITRIYLY